MKRTHALVVALSLMLTVAGAKAQLLMDEDVGYLIKGSRVQLYVEEITNFENRTTDLVRLRLWASEDRWNESDRGQTVGYVLIPKLRPYETLDDVDPRTHFYRPSRGWYYITLTLEERVRDENGKRWVIRDVFEFDDQIYFGRGHPLF